MKSRKSIKSIVFTSVIGIVTMLFVTISMAADTGKVSVETARLRDQASENSTILELISIGEEVEILGESNGWYQVRYNRITGYLSKELVTVNSNPEATEENNQVSENTTEENQVSTGDTTENTEEIKIGETYKISENTKLKLVPSINATDVIELKTDETVTITEIMNGWVCVETQTTKGWLRKDKLKTNEPEKVEEQQEEQQEQPAEETPIKTQYINSTTVNVRQEANTSSAIVTTVALNTEVQVYREENGWSKVKVNNVDGYISSSLLSDTKKETSRSQTTSRKSSSTKTNKTTTEAATTNVPASGNGSAIVATAKQYLGYKYVYGGSSPSTGFDCSGFTSYVFKQHGITLSRTSAGQYGNGVAVSRANLQPGDLVMFGKSSITHVAIYIGGGQIIHASTPSTGVRIDSLSTGYYNNNYYGARRIV